jgi:uncharacterized protein (DUF697 family)
MLERTETTPHEAEPLASPPLHAVLPEPVVSFDVDTKDAMDIVKKGVITSMAVALVPVPGVDLAGIVAVQLRMVQQLGRLYGATFRENAVQSTILALVGSVAPVTLAGGLVSALKIIPGFGSLAGAAGVSLLGGAMTYAVGVVFKQHLESGGSLLDLDTTTARGAFRREFKAGVKVVRSFRKTPDVETPTQPGSTTP